MMVLKMPSLQDVARVEQQLAQARRALAAAEEYSGRCDLAAKRKNTTTVKRAAEALVAVEQAQEQVHHKRCVWSFRDRSPVKDWRFPFKLSKNGTGNFKCIVIFEGDACHTLSTLDKSHRSCPPIGPIQLRFRANLLIQSAESNTRVPHPTTGLAA